MSGSIPHSGRGIGWAFLAAFWAALFLIPYGMAVESASFGSAVGAMLLSAAVFNTIISLFKYGTEAHHVARLTLGSAFALAVGSLVGNLGIANAIPTIGAGMTSVVLKSQVLLVPILAIWTIKEHPSPRLWVGAVIALLGFSLPTLLSTKTENSVAQQISIGWAFLAAFAFAGMQVLMRTVIHRVRSAPLNALRLWIAAGVLIVLPVEWGGLDFHLSQKTWAYAGLAGLFGPCISRLCAMTAVRHIQAATVSLVALIGPVFAYALGFWFLDQTPSIGQLAGSTLIIVGVTLPLLKRKKS